MIRFSPHKLDKPDYRWDDTEKAIQTYTEAFKETGIEIIHPSMLDFTKMSKTAKTFMKSRVSTGMDRLSAWVI